MGVCIHPASSQFASSRLPIDVGSPVGDFREHSPRQTYPQGAMRR